MERLIKEIGQIADREGFEAFVVGGYVRDVLLQRPVQDFDVMVIGDGIAFAEKVAAHFGPMVKGGVERFELPNLGALNFLLHGSLGGGGTLSLMTDAQGKTFSTALLRMYIDVTDSEAKDLGISAD